MPAGFLISIAISESHNRVIHCFSWRKLSINKESKMRQQRNTVWAAPVIVIYYHSLSTAQQELQKITAGHFMKQKELDFTSSEPDHQG